MLGFELATQSEKELDEEKNVEFSQRNGKHRAQGNST